MSDKAPSSPREQLLDGEDAKVHSSPLPPKKENNSDSDSPLYKSDEFRMYCFKVLPCSKRYCHDWTTCPFSHPGEKAKRRDPRLYTYTGIACPEVKKNMQCPRGETCPYAHNVFEYWLHPSRYRTQLCNDGANCKRKVCFFAHSLDELRVPTCKPVTPPGTQLMVDSSGMQTIASIQDSDLLMSAPFLNVGRNGQPVNEFHGMSSQPYIGSPVSILSSKEAFWEFPSNTSTPTSTWSPVSVPPQLMPHSGGNSPTNQARQPIISPEQLAAKIGELNLSSVQHESLMEVLKQLIQEASPRTPSVPASPVVMDSQTPYMGSPHMDNNIAATLAAHQQFQQQLVQQQVNQEAAWRAAVANQANYQTASPFQSPGRMPVSPQIPASPQMPPASPQLLSSLQAQAAMLGQSQLAAQLSAAAAAAVGQMSPGGPSPQGPVYRANSLPMPKMTDSPLQHMSGASYRSLSASDPIFHGNSMPNNSKALDLAQLMLGANPSQQMSSLGSPTASSADDMLSMEQLLSGSFRTNSKSDSAAAADLFAAVAAHDNAQKAAAHSVSADVLLKYLVQRH